MRKIYLDTNILVALAAPEKDTVRNVKVVNESLATLVQLKNVKLVSSIWTLTEMSKVLINEMKLQNKVVASIVNEFIKTQSIKGYRIQLIEVSPQKKYRFQNFFDDVREIMILYNPGLGDAMHSAILRNNDIKEILTLDGKQDFKIIPGILVLHPEDIKIKS